MKPERQRIKIAEACGWRRCCHVNDAADGCNGENPSGIYTVLPNYLSDLNAMREVVMSLSNTKFNRWAQELSILLNGTKHKAPTRDFLCATAAQRAEALLKALNLWEDEDHNT